VLVVIKEAIVLQQVCNLLLATDVLQAIIAWLVILKQHLLLYQAAVVLLVTFVQSGNIVDITLFNRWCVLMDFSLTLLAYRCANLALSDPIVMIPYLLLPLNVFLAQLVRVVV